MHPIIEVTPAEAPAYPVYATREAPRLVADLLAPRHRHAVVLADTNTTRFATPIARALEAAGLRVLSQVLPAGESAKTRAVKAEVEDAMLDAAIDRSACLVAVGGGVVLDLGGFVAATYMRGIDHVNVATSALAQIDAAIGGKTAINTPRGKNLIGAFHHPRAVVLDEAALAELPRIERLNGLAEAVKHAVIRDAALFDALEAWPGDDALLPEPLLHRCVAIKAEVVAADASDAGLRNMLNYGHTVAHAIEGATHGGMAHGHAVAVGMVVEARLAEAEGGFPSADRARLERLLERLGLPTTPPCSFEAAAPFFLSDKKNEAGEIRCAIPAAIGQSLPTSGRFTRAVSRAALQRAWGPP